MIEEIRRLVHATPFDPFVIHMADGRSFRVPHPDFILVGHGFHVVVAPEEHGPVEFLPVRMMSGLSVQNKTA